MIDLAVADIETTGKNAKEHLILEVALKILDPYTLEPKVSRRFLCIHPEVEETMEPVVRRMHRKNGLTAELAGAEAAFAHASHQSVDGCDHATRLRVDEETIAVRGHRDLDLALADFMVSQHYEGGQVTLCGSSIHFDRKFIDANLPLFAAFLHYRMIDLRSSLILFDLFLNRYPKLPGKAAHRAMPDVDGAIAMLRWLKRRFVTPLTTFHADGMLREIRHSQEEPETVEQKKALLRTWLSMGGEEPRWNSSDEGKEYLTPEVQELRALALLYYDEATKE